MLQQRPIQDMEQFLNSIRNFEMFYPRIKGATDIDFCYERNGNFLFLEGKSEKDLVPAGRGLLVPYGQAKMYQKLIALSNKIRGFYVVVFGEKYIVFEMHTFMYLKIDGVSYGGIPSENSKEFSTKTDLIEWVGQICDSFEKKS